jgi:hypothetical protein
MPYLVQYRYTYSQRLTAPEDVQVTIYKKSSFAGSGTPVITELVAGSEPFVVSVVDNDKNKFTPIRGKQATLVFKPQDGITANTFSSGPDDEWIVEAVVVSTGFFLFKGFLVMDDHQQAFLPVSHQYDVELIATDNLGTLKEVPLTDDAGLYIRGKKKLIEVIAQCLKKTNLQLDIIVRDTWMEESQTTFMTGLNYVFADMKTFENKIGEAVDCYEALQIICGYHLSIKQYNGQWWIENIDEKTNVNAYLFRFDYTGAYTDQPTPTTYNKTIGRTHNLKFVNKNAMVSFTRPYKFTQLTYSYVYPAEIVDNIDFSLGTWINFNTGTLIAKYQFAYWTLFKNTTPNPGDAEAYIQRKFEDVNMTYEKERFVVIRTLVNGFFYLSVDQRIPVEAKDKFTISVDTKYDVDVSGSGFYRHGMLQVVLHGEDGSTWKFHGGNSFDATPRWHLGTFDEYVYREGYLTEDLREWHTTMGGEAPPIPVSGELEIRLSRTTQVGTETHYSNLQFNYVPYINGDYSKYTGQSNRVEQTGNYKANIDDRVRLSDSPKKLFKGAMFKFIAGKYVLTERWFRAGELLTAGTIPPYPPADDNLHTFGYLQIYALWNQYNRRMIELHGSVKGLDMGTNVPDLIHNYQVDAVTTEVNYTNKNFMLVGNEQEFKNDNSEMILVETGDSTITKDYTTPLVFKYEGGTL